MTTCLEGQVNETCWELNRGETKQIETGQSMHRTDGSVNHIIQLPDAPLAHSYREHWSHACGAETILRVDF